jgi:hypothetical protein
MTDDQILEVVKAHKEGKKIEFLTKNSSIYKTWTDTYPMPLWNFESTDYRVAPEPRKPREWEAWYLPDGRGLTDAWMERHQDAGWRPIKVREVIE